MRNSLLRILACALPLALCSAGCAAWTIDTMHNEPLPAGGAPAPTRASESVRIADLDHGVFFGIALSGGGSRAANFSAAVMLELERAGLLAHATALSSVSGSSLPAAYYGLYGGGRDPARWSEAQLRERLGRDFELDWLGRWPLPQNVARYWFTNFSRSDIMKDVFDRDLFDEHRIADFGQGLPRILVNSTSLLLGERFVFSEERFREDIGSRIDTYPVANAVMASSAFPGAFHDVTLHDFRPQRGSALGTEYYYHVLDGGPSDNLGTSTLIAMLDRLYDAPDADSGMRGCFLVVVDAYPEPRHSEQSTQADTRNAIDFLIDTNVARASDALLSGRRRDLLWEVGVDVDGDEIESFHDSVEVELERHDRKVSCAVWYLGLPRMYTAALRRSVAESARAELDRVAAVVNSIPTRFTLTGVKDANGSGMSREALQQDLFAAARWLVREDRGADGRTFLRRTCEWFGARGIATAACQSGGQ